MSNPQKQRSFLRRNALSIAGFGLGLVGIGLAIYFHFASREIKSLAFVESPQRILLASPDNLSDRPFKLVDLSGEPIEENIYVASFFIWNNGTETLRSSDEVKPLRIKLPEAKRIYEVTVSQVSRPKVNGIESFIREAQQGDEIEVVFEILESDEGFRGSVVYECEGEGAAMELTGAIAGIKEFANVEQIGKTEKWTALWRRYRLIFLGVGGAFLFLLGIGVAEMASDLVARRMSSQASKRARQIMEKAFYGVILVLCVALLLWFFVGPWLLAEKDVQTNILEYIPNALRQEGG